MTRNAAGVVALCLELWLELCLGKSIEDTEEMILVTVVFVAKRSNTAYARLLVPHHQSYQQDICGFTNVLSKHGTVIGGSA